MSHACAVPGLALPNPGGAPQAQLPPVPLARAQPHALTEMRTSGYLERLGFKYRPATAATTFRQPSEITSRLRSCCAAHGVAAVLVLALSQTAHASDEPVTLTVAAPSVAAVGVPSG